MTDLYFNLYPTPLAMRPRLQSALLFIAKKIGFVGIRVC